MTHRPQETCYTGLVGEGTPEKGVKMTEKRLVFVTVETDDDDTPEVVPFAARLTADFAAHYPPPAEEAA